MNPPRAPRPRHPPNPRAHAATLPAMMGPHNQARTAAAGECMNCFVDDTALLAGVASRKNQREGLDLRKWFVQGRICLYVPIHSKCGIVQEMHGLIADSFSFGSPEIP